jgi:hypothetical protein
MMTEEDRAFITEIQREIDDGNGELLLQLTKAFDRDQRAWEMADVALAIAARPLRFRFTRWSSTRPT